mgnify:CR=1 FL=1
MDPRRALRPKKSFGQHFLVAPHAIRRIVEETLGSAAESVVEIGPGPGVLTGPLLADGRPLLAVELDPEAERAGRHGIGDPVAVGNRA